MQAKIIRSVLRRREGPFGMSILAMQLLRFALTNLLARCPNAGEPELDRGGVHLAALGAARLSKKSELPLLLRLRTHVTPPYIEGDAGAYVV
ncbi:hypothetical protein BURKHO8Y_560002 [Burkholderia sp. 8Y]|uniref:hypothetical protein n=1 Tax=Burkholderia sp. 8Y TaxID=2653133 RepID=UPI0012F399A7|nr:hypothetical protein [Burkholderia sp. 8Y]VXC90266.1 hypothetical protein BURKHO8Y_560002 [Burkholderia sp. 8Y]